MSENNLGCIKNYDYYKKKKSTHNKNDEYNPSGNHKQSHYCHDNNDTISHTDDSSICDDVSSYSHSVECECDNQKDNRKKERAKYKRDEEKKRINFQLISDNLNTKTQVLKLNSTNHIFSENIVENIDIIINLWENIICSIYKYKSDIENLIDNIVNTIELTPLDLKMSIKTFFSVVNSFINEIIMYSKVNFTNNKAVFSAYISRNTNSDGINGIQDNSRIFDHIINKPKKIAYYLNASNILTLFNIPVFAINLNDNSHLCMQIIKQEESVATIKKIKKLDTTLYLLSPNIINIENEFMRDSNGEVTCNEEVIDMEKSVCYLNHYYNSIIHDMDIYKYSKSNLDYLLNDINMELEKIKLIKKSFCLTNNLL